jgi:hypothetical protein
LHKEGRATRAPVAQTLQSVRQTCPGTIHTCPYRFARFPFCGIFTPTRTSPVNNKLNQQVETTGDGASETSRMKILSCMERTGQNTRPSHKHCKPCAKHAHAPRSRVHTHWYTVFIDLPCETLNKTTRV